MWHGPVVKQAANLGATVGTARWQTSKDRKESKAHRALQMSWQENFKICTLKTKKQNTAEQPNSP